ncbi:MAG TPA: cytidylate kinase family protein [Candidatus Bacteroides merdavium]|uniref:Cytidylate kinase family protein n=1 Tax=Candidatus Bacteroides merdavium TaxID=2838472 RepID=A0A9D2H0A2_9BACE|nr:cytidylate kinase family protein [Candidatus Bacteroides merdavium]
MNKYTVRRYLLFVASLFINAFGIAFITKALLGTSPITSVTYVLSLFTPFTMGIWTILLNLLFVVLEPFLMTRKDLKDDLRMYLLQIPISFCFGLFIDFSMFMLSWLQPSAYATQVVVLLVGCVILALGIALEVKANAAMMAGEYFVKTITRRFHGEFGYVKLGFDITLLTIACILSLVFLSDIQGVREGTVVSALLVGPIVHFVSPAYHLFDRWINPPSQQTYTTSTRQTNAIITIAREYGSGGHLLGERLAKELGLKLYDREFIRMAAQRSGIDEQYIVKNEQSIPSFWLKCILSKNSEQPVEASLSADDLLFVSESRIVQELATQGPCIIVGRCADFVLKDHPKAVKVFCYTDLESATIRCVNDYGIPQEEAEAEIRRINRNRIHHYEYYTGQKWGEPHHYHLMLNTGSIGMETACRLVKEVYQSMIQA